LPSSNLSLDEEGIKRGEKKEEREEERKIIPSKAK
jgi:hypothetical protein